MASPSPFFVQMTKAMTSIEQAAHDHNKEIAEAKEQHETETSAMKVQINDLTEQVQGLRFRINTLEHNCEQAEEGWAAAEEELTLTKQERDQFEIDAKKSEKRVERLEAVKRKLESKVASLEAKCKDSGASKKTPDYENQATDAAKNNDHPDPTDFDLIVLDFGRTQPTPDSPQGRIGFHEKSRAAVTKSQINNRSLFQNKIKRELKAAGISATEFDTTVKFDRDWVHFQDSRAGRQAFNTNLTEWFNQPRKPVTRSNGDRLTLEVRVVREGWRHNAEQWMKHQEKKKKQRASGGAYEADE